MTKKKLGTIEAITNYPFTGNLRVDGDAVHEVERFIMNTYNNVTVRAEAVRVHLLKCRMGKMPVDMTDEQLVNWWMKDADIFIQAEVLAKARHNLTKTIHKE